MIIRFASKEDLDRIANLWGMMVKERNEDWNPDKGAWVDISSKLLDTNMYKICVAEQGDIIGFLDGMVFYEPAESKTIGFGKSLYVLPEYRGKGVGGRLYIKMLGFGQERGVDALEMYCFPEKLSFWESRGFLKAQHVLRRL